TTAGSSRCARASPWCGATGARARSTCPTTFAPPAGTTRATTSTPARGCAARAASPGERERSGGMRGAVGFAAGALLALFAAAPAAAATEAGLTGYDVLTRPGRTVKIRAKLERKGVMGINPD